MRIILWGEQEIVEIEIEFFKCRFSKIYLSRANSGRAKMSILSFESLVYLSIERF